MKYHISKYHYLFSKLHKLKFSLYLFFFATLTHTHIYTFDNFMDVREKP